MNKIVSIRGAFSIFLLILFITKILVLSGCANITPPSGGPRDSLPPRLLKVNPPDSSRSFNHKTINFTFDEFIEDAEQQNPFQTILISPLLQKGFSIRSRLNTMSLTLRDTLDPNTTYKIDFGDLVKDVNEKNVLRNFSYIFATGNVIDSIELSGKVVLAETGGIDTTLIVMLHRDGSDSAVIKENPRYIAKLDGKGNFHFQYLPSGVFYLYAAKDRRYSSKELFAFADSAVEIRSGIAPITLYAYQAEKEEKSPTQGPTVSSLGGNRGAAVRADERRLRFSTSLNGKVQDLLSNFSLNFDRPLRNLDTTKLQLSTDSAFNKIAASWELDSLKKKLTLKTGWKENTLYNIVLDKDFAEDTLGRKLLKTDTINFITGKQTDYGSLKITFTNIDLSQSPVLQFIQNGQVIKEFPLSSAQLYQPLFNPGEYQLSILYDKNKNGKWDPGQFFVTKKQPELVKSLNKKITIRADWDNEFEIPIPL